MREINFSSLDDETSISKNFNLNSSVLGDLLASRSLSEISRFYKKMSIKKIRGGYRVVYKPKFEIEGFHKNILTQINYKAKPLVLVHECAHGFAQGKSTLTNANKHLNNKYLLQTDIKSFFTSILENKVKEVFVKLGCTNNIANLFSNVCTINNCLAEGLNTSPMIANIYFYALDKKLKSIANSYSCIYTRYADDLSFSSNKKFDYKSLLDRISNILLHENLKLNKTKTHFSKHGQAQYVTGLSISNSIRPRIPKKMKRRLRLEFYYIKKYGFTNHFSRRNESIDKGYNRLNGWLLYAKSVEPEYYLMLHEEYRKLK